MLWISTEPSRAMLTATSAVVASVAAIQSIGGAWTARASSSRILQARTIPIAASGMFSQNCHCQEAKRTSRAPYSGPQTQPKVSIAPSEPRARARSVGG